MSEEKHTKGPWLSQGVVVLTDDCKQFVLSARYGTQSFGEARANARLGAAAPELLEACKSMMDLDEISDILAGNETLRDVIEAAIAKALR